ncbi:MAG: [acyl-carrier-protein] S-malonyltransferase [Chloroflexi bacterium RBG_13_60_13]|nr:MAG: [acyl-carrier-protein] S-malonyltransferase [Chloroflexi bacterium RBG_13_60_13]
MNGQERTAYVFPGQGSQWVGMARDIHAAAPHARDVFEEADSALGFRLSRLCFEGPEDVLRQTVNAQPAILTVSIAYLRGNELSPASTDIPAFVAGHSLGEYTALVAAGVLTFKDALLLARERGRLMQEAGEKHPGGMLALIGLDETAVRDICDTSGIQIANINCPGQIAVSGATDPLARAAELARARGAQRVVPLQVSGAFHSRLMESAGQGMALATSGLDFRDATIPIVANTTALPITDGGAVRSELLEQLLNCVQWQKSVEYMISHGVTNFIEIGPGQVLTGLIKRINRDVTAISMEKKDSQKGSAR